MHDSSHHPTTPYTATRISDSMSWGQGKIKPIETLASAKSQHELLDYVLQSLEPVQESTYSACTDGRMPDHLLDHETDIPVRELLAGADIVRAFVGAEAIAGAFYTEHSRPVADRIMELAHFLHRHGINPSSHIGCGAATHFSTIIHNIKQFAATPEHTSRLQSLLPAHIYDEQMYSTIVADLSAIDYTTVTADHFIDAAASIGGPHAIEVLRDDGRGVSGHVEEQIIRIHIPHVSINVRKLAKLSGDRQVFGINDERMARLAQLLGGGDAHNVQLAHIAMEAFTDATHATLSKDLPTYIIT